MTLTPPSFTRPSSHPTMSCAHCGGQHQLRLSPKTSPSCSGPPPSASTGTTVAHRHLVHEGAAATWACGTLPPSSPKCREWHHSLLPSSITPCLVAGGTLWWWSTATPRMALRYVNWMTTWTGPPPATAMGEWTGLCTDPYPMTSDRHFYGCYTVIPRKKIYLDMNLFFMSAWENQEGTKKIRITIVHRKSVLYYSIDTSLWLILYIVWNVMELIHFECTFILFFFLFMCWTDGVWGSPGSQALCSFLMFSMMSLMWRLWM